MCIVFSTSPEFLGLYLAKKKRYSNCARGHGRKVPAAYVREKIKRTLRAATRKH
jgi:RNase P protein component